MTTNPEASPPISAHSDESFQDVQLGAHDALATNDIFSITHRLGTLAVDGDTVLAPHQIDAFEDIVDFFKEGGREGYVKLPTGTGKTVLFVELCKKLRESVAGDEELPRSIVLVPKIDLANQTLGSIDPTSGKRRGFTGFAPEIDARVYHSNMSKSDKFKNVTEAEVLITTYDSFRGLIKNFVEAEAKTPELWQEERDMHAKTIEDNMGQYKILTSSAKEFLSATYAKQEVRLIRQKALKVLSGIKNHPVSFHENKVLETIVTVTDQDVDMDNEQRLKIINRVTRTIARRNKRIGGQVNWLRDMDKIKKPLLDEQLINPQPEQLEDFTPFEEMTIHYLYTHKDSSRATPFDLLNSGDRLLAYRMKEKTELTKNRTEFAESRIRAIDNMLGLRAAVNRFNLIISDEAHRSIGTETWDAIRGFAQLKDIALLGLTATDKYLDRSLEDYYEKMVHELSKQEAMRRDIVNPVALFVHETGLRFNGVSLDPSGDYDRLTIRSMRFSEVRNQIAIDYAKLLAESGYHGLIPCIPGDKGSHAKVIAELLNNTMITDPQTGEQRYLRAKYILQDSKNREEYYRQMEAGEIDWFTSIDVQREGYDSDMAKAIINLRPTRSPLLATQRIGRVGRTFEGAPISIVIDLFDGIEDAMDGNDIPPVVGADVFEVDDVEQGYSVGNAKTKDLELLQKLSNSMPSRTIKAHHSKFIHAYDKALAVDGRGIAIPTKEKPITSDWQTLPALQTGYRGYLPKEMVLDAANGDEPALRVAEGRQGGRIVPLFNILDIEKMHADAPLVNPWRLYVDPEGTKWITPEGCTKMFSKTFPHIMAEDIMDAIKEAEAFNEQSVARTIGRVPLMTPDDKLQRKGFTYMFSLDDISKTLVPYLRSIKQP